MTPEIKYTQDQLQLAQESILDKLVIYSVAAVAIFSIINDIFFPQEYFISLYAIPVTAVGFLSFLFYKPLLKYLYSFFFTTAVALFCLNTANIGFGIYLIIYSMTVSMVVFTSSKMRSFILVFNAALIIWLLYINDIVLQQAPVELPIHKVIFYFVLANCLTFYAMNRYVVHYVENNRLLKNLKKKLIASEENLNSFGHYNQQMDLKISDKAKMFIEGNISEPFEKLYNDLSSSEHLSEESMAHLLDIKNKLNIYQEKIHLERI